MKQIKNLFLGLLIISSIHVSALPYLPNGKNGPVCTCADVKSICKENALVISSPIVTNCHQQISKGEPVQDGKPKQGKKRNPFKERRQVVISISQATGDVILEILEVAIDIAVQFCY